MSAAEDFTSAHESCVVFEVPDRVLVEFRGADRARFLHNFCTNDINRLEVDHGCEVIFTNIKARAVGHGFIFAGTESHWLETVSPGLDALLQHLDKYLITDDVEIMNRAGELRELFVTGPTAAQHVAAVLEADELQPMTQACVAGVGLRRVDMFGQPGVLVAVPADQPETTTRLLGGRPPGAAEAYEALRLQAGFPQYGTDVSDEHLAPEVGRIERTISYTKGCYLGQEPIARIDALGHVNKSLRGLVISGAPPESGAAVATETGEEAGTISSSAADPVSEGSFSLAWLKREFMNPGTRLLVNNVSAVVQ